MIAHERRATIMPQHATVCYILNAFVIVELFTQPVK